MLNEDDSNIKIAKVDCTTDSSICSDHDVTGYPTLKFFKVGSTEGVKFRGTRDLPTLTTFINEQLREVTHKINCLNFLKCYFREMKEMPKLSHHSLLVAW